MPSTIGPIQPGGRDIGPIQTGQPTTGSFTADAAASASFGAYVLGFAALAAATAGVALPSVQASFTADAAAAATESAIAGAAFSAAGAASAATTATPVAGFTASGAAQAELSKDKFFTADASADAVFGANASVTVGFTAAASAPADLQASWTAPQLPAIPVITVTSSGSGYTSEPTVTINNVPGAAARAAIENGAVTRIVVTNIGSAPTGTPSVTISGGGGAGAQAVIEFISPTSQEETRSTPFKLVEDGYGELVIETLFEPAPKEQPFTDLMRPPIENALLESSALIPLLAGADEQETADVAKARERTLPKTIEMRPARAWITWFDSIYRALRYATKPAVDNDFVILAPSVDETDCEWYATGTIDGVSDPAEITVTLTGASRYSMEVRVIAGGTGYTSPPTVEIAGRGGSGYGATAVAYIYAGAVVAVEVTSSGYGYEEPLSVIFRGGGGSGALAVAKLGRQFGPGDYVLWNDPAANGDTHSYEINKIISITPIDAATMKMKLERREQGAQKGYAYFGSPMRAHMSIQIYRLIPKFFPITAVSGQQIHKFVWENMLVVALKAYLGGNDAGVINLADRVYSPGTTTPNPRLLPPSPGYRTFTGAAYEHLAYLGTLQVGKTAIARISTQAWETIRNVYAKVTTAPTGATAYQGNQNAAIVVWVCFITPPNPVTGTRQAALIDTVIIESGQLQSYPITDQPDGRRMPYHKYFPLSGSNRDWPPSRLPVIENGLSLSGALQIGTINPASTVPFTPDGQIDFIIVQVGSVTAGADLIVTVQT